MCAAHAGPGAMVIDHARAPGEKIRISGGGRCNFTNMYAAPDNFLSQNPHFAKSALSRYTQWDFIDLVAQYGIPYHEKTLGQLFCDTSAKDIIQLLIDEMQKAGAVLALQTQVIDIARSDRGFRVEIEQAGKRRTLNPRHVVVACGGKSIPKMGASGFGYQIARQFGHDVTETRPALVPLTFTDATRDLFKQLAGLSVPARVSCNGTSFEEGLLFTHRGLSGPSILQISSYWHEGESIALHFAPEQNLIAKLRLARQSHGAPAIQTALGAHLPARLAQLLVDQAGLNGNLADQSDSALQQLAKVVAGWTVTPAGSEGYRTAEVTMGGVDTRGMSSRTMESTHIPDLYFIGEVVDVTGWLGGYNFQWAWSSGWAAGQAIRAKTAA